MFLFFRVTLILSQFEIYQIEYSFYSTLLYQCLFGDILYYMSDTKYYLFGLFVLFTFLSLYSSSSPLLGSFFSYLPSHISIYHNNDKNDDDTDDNEYDNDNGRSIMIKIKIRMTVLVVNIIMIF